MVCIMKYTFTYIYIYIYKHIKSLSWITVEYGCNFSSVLTRISTYVARIQKVVEFCLCCISETVSSRASLPVMETAQWVAQSPGLHCDPCVHYRSFPPALWSGRTSTKRDLIQRTTSEPFSAPNTLLLR
jgi:hypothetical protein